MFKCELSVRGCILAVIGVFVHCMQIVLANHLEQTKNDTRKSCSDLYIPVINQSVSSPVEYL